MNERLRLTAERYASDAEAYDELWAPVLLPYARDLLPALDLTEASHVLDAACGTGTLLPYLYEAAPQAHVVASDLSPGMIVRATGASCAVMDMQQLAFADQTFDAAIVAFALQHVPDPARAFASLRRVLTPGGRLGTITWAENPSFRAADVWGEELDEAGAETVATIASPETVDHPDKLDALVRQAGLQTKEVWEITGRYQMTPESFLRRFTTLGMARRRFESLSGEVREHVSARLSHRLGKMTMDDLAEPMNMIYSIAERVIG